MKGCNQKGSDFNYRDLGEQLKHVTCREIEGLPVAIMTFITRFALCSAEIVAGVNVPDSLRVVPSISSAHARKEAIVLDPKLQSDHTARPDCQTAPVSSTVRSLIKMEHEKFYNNRS